MTKWHIDEVTGAQARAAGGGWSVGSLLSGAEWSGEDAVVLTAEEESAFAAHRVEVAVRTWPRIGVLIAVAAVVWWPLDLIYFSDDPRALWMTAIWRLGLIAMSIAAAISGPHLAWARARVLLFLSSVILVELAWTGVWTSLASGGNLVWFGAFALAPVFTIPLQSPLRWRVAVAVAASVTSWLSFHIAAPRETDSALLSAGNMAFGTVLAIGVGHWLYQAHRSEFVFRRRLALERASLSRLAAELEERVAAQTADLRELSRRAHRAAAEERRRIAADLHDDLGQEITALALHVVTLRDDDPVSATRETIGAMLGRTRESLDRVLDDLQPRMLDELGLEGALCGLAAELCGPAGLSWSVEMHLVDRALGEREAVAVFRVAREALNNVVRHAGATSVEVRIGQAGAQLLVAITDDGIGLSERAAPGRGLSTIHARAAALGGEATWSRGAGTTLLVTLPLESLP